MIDSVGVNAALKKDLVPILDKYGVSCIIAVVLQTNDTRPLCDVETSHRVRGLFLNKFSKGLSTSELQERWVKEFAAWARENKLIGDTFDAESN